MYITHPYTRTRVILCCVYKVKVDGDKWIKYLVVKNRREFLPAVEIEGKNIPSEIIP